MLPNHLGLHALSLKLCHTKWVLDTFLKSHMTQVWSYWLAVSVKWLRHHFTLLSQIPASDQSWVLDIVLSSFPVSTLTFISFYMILTHHIKFIQIKWCLVCGGWCSLCLNVLSGWWPAAAVCLMFAVQDILHWVNTPACCLLLVLTYHEQHCVETGAGV